MLLTSLELDHNRINDALLEGFLQYRTVSTSNIISACYNFKRSKSLTAMRSPGVIVCECMIDLIVLDSSNGASDVCVCNTSTIARLPLFFAAISNSLRRRLNGFASNSSYNFLKSICAYRYVSSLSQHTLYVTVNIMLTQFNNKITTKPGNS
jgi:hypothetical protein